MIDVVEILQHWHAGRPKTVVAASLGLDAKTVRKYVAPAEAAGLVQGLLAGGALHHLRAAQGVVGLADKHTPQRLDAACRRAIQVGDPGYRTVKGILVAGTEQDGHQPAPASLAPAHLHGPATLFDGLDGLDGHGAGEVAG